ncbi:MAG: Glu/Leu/Phe/Val dehydrogenase [Sedimentisphaerales bacterium]|nr:Glu/Leu/Phe/Val dehydrogenase [Sedimentisphaerales bacterium]
MAIINSVFKTAQYNLMQTAERIGLEENLLRKLAVPKEKIEQRLTPLLSNGKLANIEIYIVRHNDTLGPSKGGIRMTSSVSMEEVVGLSMEMTWKTSLMGVPFGGGKTGIRFAPETVNSTDKEVIIRSVARSAKRHFGPELYIPAPDMGTNETDMGHIRDCISYSEGTSITRGCFVTGKPIILGGIAGRRQATGRGVVYTTVAACKKLGLNIQGLKVAIQGFGNVGSEAAIEFHNQGAKIIAVSDASGMLFNDKGLDIGRLCQHAKSNRGLISSFSGAESASREEFFGVLCDCLVPAAAGSQITADNVSKIKAKIISEGANAPTTPEADEVLNDNGIFVIPDILCNGGGVFVSYLEYIQETQHEQMTESQVKTRLYEKMTSCFDDVYNYAHDKKATMRKASMDLAVGRVVAGIKARGLLP